MENKELPNHIEEYLDSRGSSSEFIELFDADDKDVDLKTELTKIEIPIVNVICLNDLFLKSKGINTNVFGLFIEGYLRKRTSLDRKSRQEFVDINKKERFENNLDKFNSFQNLAKVKQ